MQKRIEDYGLIGDGETAALVSRDGTIEWLCWPRFDDDACFAALLGTPEQGQWALRPTDRLLGLSRRYRSDTLILETTFTTRAGTIQMVDFMPPRSGCSCLIRKVTGLAGRVPMRHVLRLRFDFGSVSPWLEAIEGGVVARVGPDAVVHRAGVPLTVAGDDIAAEFSVDAGETLWFTLQYGSSTSPVPPRSDGAYAEAQTQAYWHDWLKPLQRDTQWPDALRRSLITLKALLHRPTGGLVAAPTTSLPEKAAGERNWDYRYCWLRDATFTMSAFLNAGYRDEALAWRDWLLRVVAGTPSRMRIMYRVDGSRHLNEWEVDWLPGFNGAHPVRVGNAAANQRQTDVVGELLDALQLGELAGFPITPRVVEVEDLLLQRLEETWQEPGQSLWEDRDEPRHYTYSKVMGWVGVDRQLRARQARGTMRSDERRRLEALRERIHAEICRDGYRPGLGTFVAAYGGKEVDASLLLLPLLGFLPIDDERIRGTLDTICRELVRDDLVYRNPSLMKQGEGAFLACSCWLADCLLMQGRRQEAGRIVERVLSVTNDLGLLSEEYDREGRHLAGNFPQALSHLALVNTLLSLSGPVLQRAGG